MASVARIFSHRPQGNLLGKLLALLSFRRDGRDMGGARGQCVQLYTLLCGTGQLGFAFISAFSQETMYNPNHLQTDPGRT